MKIPSIARYLYTIIQWYTFRSDTCWCAAFVGGVSFGLLIVNIRNDVSKLDQCWSPSIMFFTLLYAFLHLPDFWVPWRFNKWCVCWDYYVCCCDITTSGILSLRNIEVFGTLGLRILNISKDHGGGFRVALVSGRNSQRPTALEAWFLGVNSMQRRSKSGRLWVVSFPKVWRWGLKPRAVSLKNSLILCWSTIDTHIHFHRVSKLLHADMLIGFQFPLGDFAWVRL